MPVQAQAATNEGRAQQERDRMANIRTRTHDRRNIADPRGPRTYPRQATRPVASIPSVLSSGSPTGPRSMHSQGRLLGFLRNNLFGQTNLPARNRPAPKSRGITPTTAAGSSANPGCVAIDSPREVPGGNRVVMSVSDDGSGKMIRDDMRPIPPEEPVIERAIQQNLNWISSGGVQRTINGVLSGLQRARSAFRGE